MPRAKPPSRFISRALADGAIVTDEGRISLLVGRCEAGMTLSMGMCRSARPHNRSFLALDAAQARELSADLAKAADLMDDLTRQSAANDR